MTRVITYIALLILLTMTKALAQNETKIDSAKNVDQNQSIVEDFAKKTKEADAKILKIKEETKKRIETKIAELKNQNATEAEILKVKNEEIIRSSEEISKIKVELLKSVDKKITEKINNDETILDTTKTEVRFSISKPKKYLARRTTSQIVFAAGINNVIQDGKYGDKDFRIWGSHFYEFGFTFNTRIIKDNNLLHFKYGISGIWNNLRPTDNRIVDVVDGKAQLISAGRGLTDSRFRNAQIIFPMHLEFDFSRDGKTSEGKTYYRTHEGFRMGLGGYLGLATSSRHHVEYEENGNEVEIVSKGDYKTSDFIYGLSAYIGHGQTSFYVKYDLNPLFRSSVQKMNNISLGLRYDLD